MTKHDWLVAGVVTVCVAVMTAVLSMLPLAWAAPATPVEVPALTQTSLNASPWQDDYTHWLFIAWGSGVPFLPGKIVRTETGQRVIYREWHSLPAGSAHAQPTPFAPPRGEGTWEEKPGKVYGKIGGLFTDITSTFLAYTAYGAGNGWYAVFGEHEWGPYSETPRNMIISPDGKRLIYQVHSNGEDLLIIDGQPGITAKFVKYAKDIYTEDAPFSTDSKHVVYCISDDAITWRYVIDGKLQPVFHDIEPILFSPDGLHYAYFVTDDAGKHGIVCDGITPVFKDEGYRNLLFSPNSKSLAYVAFTENKTFVVQDGKPLHEFSPVALDKMTDVYPVITDLIFSADSQTLAYHAKDETQDLIVTSGATWKMPAGYQCTSLALSPDGTHVALVAGAVGKQTVYVDGKAGREYYEILPIRNANNQPNGYIRFSANDTFHYFVKKSPITVPDGVVTYVVEEHLSRKGERVIGE